MLPKRKIAWSSYLAGLRAAFTDPQSHFFADTSFLFAVGSLHAAARGEVGDWIAALGRERFHVPAWVAQETYRRLTSETHPFTPMKVAATEVAGRLAEVRAEARRFVDDGVADGFQVQGATRRDRAAFLIGLDEEVERLERRLLYLKDASSGSLDDAADFLAGVINDHVIASDLYSGLSTLEADYEARLTGEHPPGYKDRKKEQNRYGDLLFWREVVAFCRATLPESIVLCSNDTKPDWAFTPPTMIDDTEGMPPNRQVPNNGLRGFKIVLPQPLLVHEIGRELPGFRMHLMTLPMLSRVSAMDERMPGLVQAYSSIAQQRQEPRDGEVPEETPSPPAPERSFEEARRNLARIDQAAEAVVALEAVLASGTLSGAELRGLGRGIVEAAQEGPEATELFGRTLLSQADAAGAGWGALFEGMLLAAYTREDGRARAKPLDRLLPALFDAARRDGARPAVDRLRTELGTARSRFLLLPGDDGRVDVNVVSRGREGDAARLAGLTAGTVELVVDASRRRTANTLFALSGDVSSTTVERFLDIVANHFRVPADRVALNLALADTVSWDELQALVEWGTDTDMQLR